MSDTIISYIRTVVPVAIGAAISFLALHGLKLDRSTSDAIITAATGILIALYYLLVRLFEQYVSPKFGWLLGVAKKPAYGATTAPTGK